SGTPRPSFTGTSILIDLVKIPAVALSWCSAGTIYMSAEPTIPAGVPKRSATEGIKEASRALRGDIAAELLQDTPKFNDQNKQLLKFHGTYQQEDRDARKSRRAEGLGKHFMFMVRCKIPGGCVTADQYLAVDELAGKYANGTIRFTSRQG